MNGRYIMNTILVFSLIFSRTLEDLLVSILFLSHESHVCFCSIISMYLFIHTTLCKSTYWNWWNNAI